MITREQLTADLTSLGLKPGDVVMVHSSLSALGPVDGGADTVVDALLEAIGPTGTVIAVDMTEAMLEKTRAGADSFGLDTVDVRQGVAETLPAKDGSVDVVISNGVVNLCPDKIAVLRVLRPGCRIQIADIVVHTEVPQDAKDDIDLWSG